MIPRVQSMISSASSTSISPFYSTSPRSVSAADYGKEFGNIPAQGTSVRLWPFFQLQPATEGQVLVLSSVLQ